MPTQIGSLCPLGVSKSPTAIYSDGDRAIMPLHPGVMNARRLARDGKAELQGQRPESSSKCDVVSASRRSLPTTERRISLQASRSHADGREWQVTPTPVPAILQPSGAFSTLAMTSSYVAERATRHVGSPVAGLVGSIGITVCRRRCGRWRTIRRKRSQLARNMPALCAPEATEAGRDGQRVRRCV